MAGRAGALLGAQLEAQRPNLPLWAPILLGLGIGVYFALPSEPRPWLFAALGVPAVLGLATALRTGYLARILILALVLPVTGFGLAAWRTHGVAAPVLAYPMMANVEGTITGLDRSASGRPRVTLGDVIFHGRDPARTPALARISLEPDTPQDALLPGRRILSYARMSPPAAPAEPGGFDFRKFAWFHQIGAVGYSRTPVIGRPGEGRGLAQAVFAMRVHLSRAIQERMPGRTGGFAAAILTGDRAGVDPDALAALRHSNLAHLLAISGLHMGLLAGFVFAAIRYGLALVPRVALYHSTKKIAAVIALAAAGGYLALSGASVATQRAFIMTAVVLVAVLLDRPALTLRAVALAALIILVRRPESLTEAGFQMSFAATTALVAAFEWLRRKAWWRETQHDRRWRFLRPIVGVTATSLVAGLATAPISAFHFNIMSQFGLLANILAVPAMGMLVMPAGVLAALLAPFGLSSAALWVMGLGIEYILQVAEFVAGLDGSVRAIPAGPMASLALICLGGLFWALWIGRARSLAVLPVCAGLLLWAQADRPDILVAENGRLFGIRTEAGRVVSSERGNSFAAESWLGSDGDAASQREAFARRGMERRRGYAEMEVPGAGKLVYLGSARPPEDGRRVCDDALILLAPRWTSPPGGDCLFIGSDLLRREGSLAITLGESGPRLRGARSVSSGRPWSGGYSSAR